MSKQADIIDKMRKGRKTGTGAAAFIESMTEQVQENKVITENVSVPEAELITEYKGETVNVHEQETEQVNEHITEQFIEPDNEYEPEQQTISVLEKYNNKKTKEETFTRQTYMIRNDLIKRLHNAAKGRGKGFKTDVINDILERFLNDNKL